MVYVPRMSQEEKAARREQIAKEIESYPLEKRRDVIPRLSRKYKLSEPTILAACKEHKVKYPAIPRAPSITNKPTERTLRIINAIKSGVPISKLAKRFKLARQRIYAIRARAIELGLIKE